MIKNFPRKLNKKRMVLILSAIGIVILFLLSAAFTLGSQEEAKHSAGLENVNENRSQVLVTGRDYALNYEQEQEHREELAREEKRNEERQQQIEEQREQIETPEEETPSIVEREETRREEQRDNPPEETQEQTPPPNQEQEQKPENKPEEKRDEQPEEKPDVRPEDNSGNSSEGEQTPDNNQEQQTPDNPDNNDSEGDSNPDNRQEDNNQNNDNDNPQDTPSDNPGGSGSNDDQQGDSEGNTPGPSDNDAEGDGSDGTGGDDNSGDGGDSGDNPSENPDEPDDVNKNPIIDCSLSDGETINGSTLVFNLKGTDYTGRTIDSFYYSVTLDGSTLYSSGSDGDYTTYRAYDLDEGQHEIRIIMNDSEGNSSSARYLTLIDPESEEIETIGGYITLNAGIIGLGTLINEEYYEVNEGSSVADFVVGALASYGYTSHKGPGGSFYLARISSPGMIGHPSDLTIPDDFAESAYLDSQDPDSLGEKDIVATSGWLYKLNGVYMGTGMGGVTLSDGDEIIIWFTLNPDNDPNI